MLLSKIRSSTPYEEPRRHFKFDDLNITSEIAEERRAEMRRWSKVEALPQIGAPLPPDARV